MTKITIHKEAPIFDNKIGDFFTYLLNSVTNLHIKHFTTRNDAEHRALGDLYSGLEDGVDKLIEVWQGKRGEFVEFTQIYPQLEATGLEQAKTIRDYINNNRMVIGSESNIQNEVDELVSLFDQQIYKLTFLE